MIVSNRHGRTMVITVLAALAPLAVAATASAAPPTVTTQVEHVQFSEHYDGNPNCGTVGATEFLDGRGHLQIVADGDMLHVEFAAEFTILEVPDDPSIPVRERRGTDAFSSQLVNNGGVVITHESYHEKNTVFGDIRLYTTFVAVDGQVKVDHFFGQNLPPPGC
jgi:hypothetical protein